MNQDVKSYIHDKLKRIPDKSGVYFMKDSKSEIIYIGKAKSLKKRVSSYFNNSNKDAKTTALVEHIRDIEYILTENEVEALILEAEMIRKHKPHYNILLKDQKSFPFIAITNEHFPRVIKARNVIDKDNARKYKKYYGPYVAAERADNIVKFIIDNFKLRRCKYDFPLKRPIRPCLYHHIGKCTAPCADLIKEEDYDKTIDDAIMVLEGNVDELVARLKQEMFVHAEKLEFEAAKDLRDKIDLLKYITVEQSIYIPESDDIDIIGAYGENGNYTIVILSVKGGKLADRKTFSMQSPNDEDYYNENGMSKYSEILSAFFTQYYTHANLIPASISTDFPLNDVDIIKDYLKQVSGRDVDIKLDKSRKGLMAIANENAKHLFKEKALIREVPLGITRLQEIFKLKKAPSIIESFDIAHIQGSYTMAGMVRFVNGVSDNKNYRIFNMKTVTGIDDFASIKEAVYRRYKRLRDENLTFPDLILIDGGKGQLNSAIEALKELDIKGQPIMALAKKFEEIYLPNRNEPVQLSDNEPARLFLQKVRDETHRWVNSSHGKKRSREMVRSELESIEGIGKKTIEKLYSHFINIDNIKNASFESIRNIPGISYKAANNIYDHFHK
ncbi:excinuclease ABC subunit UvrC [Brachyspira hyodysenteriae]|uniref:excinuclease ABC subunit UvrC n=1 Tax=Brachyspira hyodysenteriae TaxID=159 RepID=UPI00063DBE96|nr:excinuclease ABC subunit UvrC [Brachyspira hyodysenteriae]KLI60464.1 excinuclease ABC subunit C [Brachyspira hyodysenteriae]